MADREGIPAVVPGVAASPEASEPPSGTMPSCNQHLGAILFGTVIFAASVWYIGCTFQWKQIAQILKDVNLTYLIAGGGSSIVLYWMLRALRWHILLKQTGTTVPVFDLYMCTAVSLSLSLFTPLQSGEMLKVELLRKYGLIRRFPGYGSFLVERVLDLVTVLATACISLLTTLDILPNRSYAYYLIAALTLSCAIGILTFHRIRLKGRARQLLDHMRQCVRGVPMLLLISLVTCASWASVAFSWQVFLNSGALQLSFAKAIALMSVVALISVFSLIPGGLGISEVGTAQVLMRFGFAPATAQAGTLVLRSYSLIAIALGIAHLGVWKLARMRRKWQRSTVEKT